jgi:photosynthetic reaction center cytochrome c subunit
MSGVTMIIGLLGIVVTAIGARAASQTVSEPRTHSALTPALSIGKADANVDMSSIANFTRLAWQSPQGTGQRGAVMVDDVFKNVQVLKGITVDEFMGTMGLMSAALGFCCNDCHSGAGTERVKWEEDNAKKRVARRMLQMVQTLNRDGFNGRQAVTCWTCHRGRDVPVVTPRLDAVYSEPVVELDDVLGKATGVPTPEQLIDKYLQAIGGADKVAAMTSIVAKGQSVGFGGFGGGGEVELYAQTPDKRATYIHWPSDPDRGQSIRTFDGRTGWMATPLAVVPKYPLAGGELDGARLDAQLTFPAQIMKVLTNMRSGPPDYIMGNAYYTLQGNGARNSLATLYFDRQSGLLVRIVRYTPSAIGRVPTQVEFADYRDVGGIKFPYHWTFTWLDGRDNWDFTSVQFNTSINASTFGEPTSLK